MVVVIGHCLGEFMWFIYVCHLHGESLCLLNCYSQGFFNTAVNYDISNDIFVLSLCFKAKQNVVFAASQLIMNGSSLWFQLMVVSLWHTEKHVSNTRVISLPLRDGALKASQRLESYLTVSLWGLFPPVHLQLCVSSTGHLWYVSHKEPAICSCPIF